MYILRGPYWRKVPRPFRGTVCGLPGALSVIETDAVRTPCAVGLNVTVMRQLAPAARAAGQLLDWAKSPGSAPVRVMAATSSSALPTLVSFTLWARLVVPTVRRRGKSTLAGFKLTLACRKIEMESTNW